MSENKEKWVSSFMQLEREHETTDLGNSKGIYCLSCTNNFDLCHHKIILVGVTGNQTYQSNNNESDLQFDEIGNLGKKSENKFEKTDEKMDWDNFDDEEEAELRCDEYIKELGSS